MATISRIYANNWFELAELAMLNGLEFKPLTTAELPAVIELDRLCFGGLWTLEGYQRELASDCSHFILLSVESDPDDVRNGDRNPISLGKVSGRDIETELVGLGCFWSIVEEAHVTLLGIHPEYRSIGLGKLLLYALLKRARETGLERATLEVRASNQSAISLYEHFGFKIAGKRRRYYQDNNEDALIFWRGGLQYPGFELVLKNWERELSDRHSISYI